MYLEIADFEADKNAKLFFFFCSGRKGKKSGRKRWNFPRGKFKIEIYLFGVKRKISFIYLTHKEKFLVKYTRLLI